MSTPFDVPIFPQSGGGLQPAAAFAAYQSGTVSAVADENFVYNVITMGSDHFDGEYFTAPKDGLYQFNWVNYGGKANVTRGDAEILVDRSGAATIMICWCLKYMPTHETEAPGTNTGSMSTVYRIEKGNKVYVKSPTGWQMTLSPNSSADPGNQPSCWFSGFYISP